MLQSELKFCNNQDLQVFFCLQNEWLACDSARDVGNLLRCFHEERSVLKQQVMFLK